MIKAILRTMRDGVYVYIASPPKRDKYVNIVNFRLQFYCCSVIVHRLFITRECQESSRVYTEFKVGFLNHFSDENRDINIHSDDDLKRQRIHYSGDQLYSNVRLNETFET